jgi:hypothetical protein
VSLEESGDHAIAEWKLAATQTVPHGSVSYQSRFCCMGRRMRVERTEKLCNGRIRPRFILADGPVSLFIEY